MRTSEEDGKESTSGGLPKLEFRAGFVWWPQLQMWAGWHKFRELRLLSPLYSKGNEDP